jgi:hypothetical protein
MTALPRRRRNRTVGMLVTTVLVAALVPVLGYIGVKAVLDSTGGRNALADNLPEKSFPTTPTGLYLTTDADGDLSSATVFVVAPTGGGGSIVPVPVNADVGLSATARKSLQQVFAEGGLDATSTAIESLLLVTINFSAQADAAQLETFLTPYQPFTVALATAVPAGADGQAALAPGTAVLQAANAARVLTVGAGDGNETVRQANIQAMWTGVVASVGAGRPSATPVTVAPTTFDELVSHVFAGQTQSRGLGSIALTSAENPQGLDVVQLDRSEAVLVFASVAPGSTLPTAIGPVIRLEAPVGYDLQVKLTIDKLLFLNANVVSVDTTATPQANTLFLVPDEATRALVQTTDLIFGDITFGTPTFRIAGVDVTIVLGTDYLAGLTS